MKQLEWRGGLFLVCVATVSGCGGGAPRPAAVTPSSSETRAALTARDLRIRLEAYADDSMSGREAGTPGNVKATEYLAREARTLGLEPAGEDGTYFQKIPFKSYAPDETKTLSFEGADLSLGEDYLPLPPVQNLPVSLTGRLDGLPVVYGGRGGDPGSFINAQDALGRVVIIGATIGPSGDPIWNVDFQSLQRFFESAEAILYANLDYASPGLVNFISSSKAFIGDPPGGPMPVAFISEEVAERSFGSPLDSVEPGARGTPFEGSFGFAISEPEYPTRNVIAVLRGSDPAINDEYVAIGAHSDHVGTSSSLVDHDSLRIFNSIIRPQGLDDPRREPTPEEARRIQAALERVRDTRPMGRTDTIFNGADDDGSGTVTMLEIAEELAAAATKPRRSILFVWHNAEEWGLLGSEWFTDNPTVSRDKIVAQVNMDMIGRGNEDDLPNGGMAHLELVGSRRLSTELGDLIEEVNQRQNFGFELDYQYDADGHPLNLYCRSDHWNYARYGIPVVFLSTGGHRDYHMVTDEPQYVNYDKLARVGTFVMSIVERIANLDHRLTVDKPIPNPDAPCQQ